jgi:hypothetical protein
MSLRRERRCLICRIRLYNEKPSVTFLHPLRPTSGASGTDHRVPTTAVMDPNYTLQQRIKIFKMKNSKLSLAAVVSMLLTNCGQNSQTQTTANITLNAEQTENVLHKNLEEKFLITNTYVGYFRPGNSWQNISINDYNYEYIQSYGSCQDGCCDGGFSLGNKLVENEYGFVTNPAVTIGAAPYAESEFIEDDYERKNAHKNNKDVFYIDGSNCSGWYWKDKIRYLVIYSGAFKTKEGIGVGSTLEEIKEKFGKLQFYVGWIEEDENALRVLIKSYPKISFILKVDDYKGDWEKISNIGEENSLSISDFRENTKIDRLTLYTE